jgi:hypothetical protein
LRRSKIEEEDYLKAREELGWQVLEDVSHELADLAPEAEDLLYDLTAVGSPTTFEQLRSVVQKKVVNAEVDAVIDVLIWSGCIGVLGPKGATYIADCGFRRQFIRSLMDQTVGTNTILLHPTLCSLIS